MMACELPISLLSEIDRIEIEEEIELSFFQVLVGIIVLLVWPIKPSHWGWDNIGLKPHNTGAKSRCNRPGREAAGPIKCSSRSDCKSSFLLNIWRRGASRGLRDVTDDGKTVFSK